MDNLEPWVTPDSVTVGHRFADEDGDGQPDHAPRIPPAPVPDAALRIVRTIVQVILGRLTAALILAVPELRDVLTEELQAWAVTAVSEVLAAVLAAGWAYLMSRPKVNGFLRLIGLAA